MKVKEIIAALQTLDPEGDFSIIAETMDERSNWADGDAILDENGEQTTEKFRTVVMANKFNFICNRERINEEVPYYGLFCYDTEVSYLEYEPTPVTDNKEDLAYKFENN